MLEDAGRLGDGRVSEALLSEFLEKPRGRFEDASGLSDILTEHDDPRIRTHLVGDRALDRLTHRELHLAWTIPARACRTLRNVTAANSARPRKRTAPVSVHRPPAAWRARPDAFPGTRVRLVVDSGVAGADMYGGIIELEPGTKVPLHWHRRGELQFVLSGRGFLLHPNGRETAVGPRSAVFSPAGRDGAHGFRAIGRRPLAILFLYGSPRGMRPWIAPYQR